MVVGEFTQETDLVVIGGGPAGYSAAFRAAELGVSTVIVDSRDALGGVCLHEGCIPSKTLLHVAETVATAEQALEFGIIFAKPQIDLDALRSWKDKSIKRLASGLEALCQKHGVERIRGQAHFEDSRHIGLLDSSVPRIRFRRALIAAGSRPKVHFKVPFDGTHVLTPGQALALAEIPKTLLIIGHDSIAIELAGIFSSIGSRVTLAFEGDRLLPQVDHDLVRPLIKRLHSRLAALQSETMIESATVKDAAIDVTFQSRKTATFDRIIISEGQIGNTTGLGLEQTKVEMNAEGFIKTDSQLRTNDARIFAAGDVTGGPWLADKSMHQGRIAAEVIGGLDSVYDPRAVPTAIFTDPQIAWCGMTEDNSKQFGEQVRVAQMPWGASGRAVGMGRIDGLTKLVFEAHTQLVLGVGMVGSQACEMIAEAALAIELGATLYDLAATIHPHPTMSELLSDAARHALGDAP